MSDILVSPWDDNPTHDDLLGFRDVVHPVVNALMDPGLDRLTVGIHAPWGGGKTSVLNLIRAELKDRSDGRCLVVKLSPWEFDRATDVRGEVIGEVLAALAEDKTVGGRVADYAQDLLKRVSWMRVASVAAKGVMLQTDALKDGLGVLQEVLTPALGTGEQRSMRDFRAEFSKMLSGLSDEIDRVVVLVDDLDRCLPPAVVETFEAIKLFLAVEGMSFVIAADTAMVRHAVQETLGSTSDGEVFARRYVEKIVQMPVTLPRLAQVEMEAYLTLLLASKTLGDEFALLVEHCDEGRRTQRQRYSDGFKGQAVLTDHFELATRLAQGLRADQYGSPRELKRFLNALGVRQQLASARGLELSTHVVAKLYLLETQHAESFAVLVQQPENMRANFMEKWEEWAEGPMEADPPAGVSPDSRRWALEPPKLSSASLQLSSYLTLAASLLDVRIESGGRYSPEALAVARQLATNKPSSGVIRRGEEAFAAATPMLRGQVVEALCDLADTPEQARDAIRGLITAARLDADLRSTAIARIRERYWSDLEVEHVTQMRRSNVEELTGLLQEVKREGHSKLIREAARKASS